MNTTTFVAANGSAIPVSSQCRPIPIEPQLKNIPAELKELRQWVVWRYELRKGKGKWTKPPYNARTHEFADSANPETWSSFDEAVKAWQNNRNRFDGIGFVFSPDDPYCGIDFDHCFDDEDYEKTLKGDVARWIQSFSSYTEFSVSGAGLHFIVKGKPSHNGKHSKAGVEIYDKTRFFTFTGDSHHDAPLPIAERQEVVDTFVAEYFPPKKADTPKPRPAKLEQSNAHVTVNDRLQKAISGANGAEILALWNGDCSAYGDDHSAADLALCAKLAFYCEGSTAILDELFRRSQLMRPKWDEKHYSDGRTYGDEVLSKAIAGVQEFYNWTCGSVTRAQRGKAKTRQPASEATSDGGAVTHALVLKRILDSLQPCDFCELGGFPPQTEIKQKHYLVLCIRQLLDTVKAQNFALARKNDFIFVYNGQYWREIDRDKLKDFLGEAAERLGVSDLEAQHYEFKDKLYKQFLAAASFDEVEADKSKVLINLQNGTFEIAADSQGLRDFKAEDFLRHQLPFEYDETATAPLFTQ